VWNRFLIWLGIRKEVEPSESCYCADDDCPNPPVDYEQCYRNGCPYEDWEYEILKDENLDDEEVAGRLARTSNAVKHKREKVEFNYES